nr:E3 ubiquitin-protein ligase TRIM38 isoform X2 [Nerophis lumbriciformis]
MSPLTFGLVLCCTLTGMYRNHTNNLCNRGLLCEYKSQFDGLEREIRAEFGNLHRFLMEEECRDLERLKRQRGKLLKQLKDREKKISAQRKDLEKAIMVLNNKLAEDEGPKMLKDIQDLLKRLESPTVLSCVMHARHPSSSLWKDNLINYHLSSCPNKQVSGQIRPSNRGGHGGAFRTHRGADTVQNMEAHAKLPLPKYYICDFRPRDGPPSTICVAVMQLRLFR